MIILVGASASGKTEIAKNLAKVYKITKVITHTTRKIRINEIQDQDYHFVSKEKFLELKQNNYFVETTFYNGNYYGTSKKEISDEKCLIVDPNGLRSFELLNDPRIVTFCLVTSKEIRKKRMESRGDKEEDIIKRLSNDDIFFSKEAIGNVDYIIDSENASIDELTTTVYEKYKKHLANLK